MVKFRSVVNRQEIVEGFRLEAHLARIRVLAGATTFEALAQTLLRILGKKQIQILHADASASQAAQTRNKLATLHCFFW